VLHEPMPNKTLDDDLVMSLVELALAQPPEEREVFLQNACGGDSTLTCVVRKYTEWEERMKGFLLEPLFPARALEHPFEPEELVAGRFRIVRELGEGGMGIVYQAKDEKLERHIALKIAKTGFRKRLPPEVRNASEISHPNVCKIFEIHTASTSHGEVDFLTMELLEGETLARRLRRGRLAEWEGRHIARQLCAGLAEAHRNGVVHGDVKSNNVILVSAQAAGERFNRSLWSRLRRKALPQTPDSEPRPQGAVIFQRAVITDFGLARRSGMVGVRGVGQSLEPGGTQDYMAPELWKGEKTSPASDVYALGVVLCELITGRRPFAKDVPLEKRLTQKPLLKLTPGKWARALTRCLEPDPARRFQSAIEVEKALAPPPATRWWLTAAAAVWLALVTAAFTYEQVTAPTEIVRLAMPPIDSSSSDIAAAAAGLSRDTAKQLAKINGGKVARFSFSSAQKDLTHVLHATLAKQNGQLTLHALLTDQRSRTNVKDWTAAYAPGEERYIPVALAGMVTAALKLPPLTIPQVNSAASKDYWDGVWYTRQYSTADDSVRALTRAVNEDPDSPLTHAALAEAEWFSYWLSRDESQLDSLRESLQRAEERSPDVPAAHRVEGYLFYRAGLYGKAEAEFERAIFLQPASALGYIWLGKSYEGDNQPDLARLNYEKATRAEPRSYRGYDNLGAYYFSRSDYPKAIAYSKQAADLAPAEPGPHVNLGVAYMESLDFPDAERELERARQLKDTAGVETNIGLTLMFEGRDREAVEYFLRAENSNSEPEGGKSLVLLHLGIAYRRLGQRDKANSVNKEGLKIAKAQMERNPRDGYINSHLAYFSAALGDRRAAESEISRALGLSPEDSNTRWFAALTYEELFRLFQDPALRLKTLEILRRDPLEDVEEIAHWPDLADLQRDSRFLEMRASHQGK
jgi:eukaryotic-like serine/threonine-protein kinase